MNIRKICKEKDDVKITLDIEEAEEEKISKKTRTGRKGKDEGSVEEVEEESVKKTSRKKGEVNPASVDKGKVNSIEKAKAKTIRNVTMITLGKKAADKMKDKNKDKILKKEKELDFKEEWEEEEELSEKIEEKKKKNKQPGKKEIGQSIQEEICIQGVQLLDPNTELWNDESYKKHFLAFLPDN